MKMQNYPSDMHGCSLAVSWLTVISQFMNVFTN